jgi:ribosomal protein S18 acetylase RimI-like enzyme
MTPVSEDAPSHASVRIATEADAEAIAPLLAELGYPAEPADVRGRLRRLLSMPDAGVLVTDVYGRAAAVAAYQLVQPLERPRPQCRITTLVVDREHRRRRLARTLLAAVEAIARERCCFRLEVTTGPWREDALALYAAAGFEQRPHRLVKPLS